MSVFSFTDECISTVPAARLFKALAMDSHNLFPKAMPQAIKSIDIVQGDGGVGTIKQVNIIQGSRTVSVKNRVDELNKETLTYRYTMTDLKKFESIVHEVKFEPTPEGGSKSKITGTLYAKGDVEVKEEDVKADKEKTLALFKAAEAYLLQNPDIYA